MNSENLKNQLYSQTQFKEIWFNHESGSKICALINGKVGWLMYLLEESDAGFSSRNKEETSKEEIEYRLNNGQSDYYPKGWSFDIKVLEKAIREFIRNGNLPKSIEWNDDSQSY